MNTIFVITCIEERGNHTSRTLAWYHTFELAFDAVMGNDGDMCEGETNHWAVIEETRWGTYPAIVAEHWFEWQGGEDGRYKPCTKPDFSRNLTNWGIG